jgi:hypothetical protein
MKHNIEETNAFGDAIQCSLIAIKGYVGTSLSLLTYDQGLRLQTDISVTII